ncbi:2,3-bisphosphoglycerate-independent phosphoglycerate mutase [Candidatus Peregrinibacteria bacterium]|nr:2,3-bisphosphoglycerate-independent phosphoglycerate mutase [Candidatus Peregrinibacteria bacterium]
MHLYKDKVLLIVLDGYGEYKDYPGNAVTHSHTPVMKELREKYPHTLIHTEGNYVGLPRKTQGGSEVGHFTMGAGRIVWQTLEEINRSIKNGSFFKHKYLREAAKNCELNNSAFHILGMISDQSVHSHIDHLFALLKFAKMRGLKKVYIHAITDGRDVPEKSAKKYIEMIQKEIKRLGLGKIATIIGRYYAMDRDTNWNRTKIAYDLYTLGKGTIEPNPIKAIDKAYKLGADTDYYIGPILIDKNGLIKNEDSVVFFNYRTDRARQITKAFAKRTFKDFTPKKRVNPLFVCFGPYSKRAPIMYPAPEVKNNLNEILVKNSVPQLRIAETEKYAHVTYFFNSQIKEQFPHEKWVLIHSPKCPSYAQKPEMSAPEVTSALIKEIKHHEYGFILLNFANCDLVGHSGVFSAAKKAVETLDKCIAKILAVARPLGYQVLITGDHGNAEYMIYEKNNEVCPSHTTNPTIFMIVSDKYKNAKLRRGGGLQDIAPTVLKILGIKKPREMTGRSLIV